VKGTEVPRTFPSIVAVLALAAGAAACGGGGPSKADFTAKAGAACAPGNATLGEVAKPSSLPELGTAAGTVASTADAQAAALGKLKAPSADKAAVAGIVRAIADAGPAARAVQDVAGKTDDAARARAATDLKAKGDAAAQQATSYGLTGCAVAVQGAANNIFEGTRSILKAAFVARADSLCAEGNRKVDALNSGKSLSAYSRFLATYLPIEEKLFNDIRALAPPPGDETTIADMLAAQDKVTAKDKEIQAAAAKGSASQVDRLEDEESTLVTAANSKFDAYGLRNCGSLGNF